MSCSRPTSALANKFRAEVRSPEPRIRFEVLKGAFYADTETTIRWKSPSWKLLIFVSSPFTDTQMERSFLIDEYQFKLREIGQRYGIAVIFVDMRWGIQDENTVNHQTWEQCAKAIEWCKVESMGIAFLSLQGNKYGYTPLPRVVAERDMNSHLTKQECSDEIKELIFDWYRIDDNSDPGKRNFVLRNMASLNDPLYWDAWKKILPVLSGLPFDTTNYNDLRVGNSVTEWEVRAALDSYPCDIDKSKGICWSFRNFTGDIDDKSFCDFKKDEDQLTEKKWTNLISFMKQKENIPEENIHEHSMTFRDFKMKDCKSHLDYFESFKNFIESKISNSLDDIKKSQIEWNKDGMGVGLEGIKLTEMLHHCNFAKEKCSTFIGREHLVKSVLDLVHTENRQTNEGFVSLHKMDKKTNGVEDRTQSAGNMVPQESQSAMTSSVPLQINPVLIEEQRQAIIGSDAELQLKAVQEFRRLLSIEKSPPIQQVIEAGVVPIFVEFLQRNHNPSLQIEAAWALTNIASGASEHTHVVIDAGALPIFVQLLLSLNEDLREQTTWALGNIAGNSVQCRDLVLEMGALTMLLNVAEVSELDLFLYAKFHIIIISLHYTVF